MKMPIYEYACENCGEITEKLVGISGDNTKTECAKCGSEASKIMSASAFHLKGGGWYSQGYTKGGSCSSKSDSPACQSCPASQA